MAQKQITNRIEFGQKLNPADDYSGMPAVSDDGNLQNLINKVDKIKKFWSTGEADGSIIRYVPNVLPVNRQDQIKGVFPRMAYASDDYTDKKTLKFTVDLAEGTYTNYSNVEIVLPIQFTKKTSKTSQMDANMIPVNGFFFHCFNELDIKRYPDDVRILPTDKAVSITDYAKNQLKYLPKNSVKKLLKPFLYSNEPVYFDENTDRRSNTNNTDAKRSDPNLTKRIKNLKDFVF